MDVANLYKSHRTIKIESYEIIIRKHSLAYSQYYALAANSLFERNAEGTIVGAKKDKEVFKGLEVDYVLEAIVSWNLKDTDGSSVPVTLSTLSDLQNDFPDFFNLIHAQVRAFNAGLDEQKKSS